MYCLTIIDQAKIPNDIIKLYLNLYPYIGRNHEMLGVVARDFDVLVEETIKKDSYYFAKLCGVEIVETRARQLLTRDVQPKSKEERLLRNIKKAFTKIHRETDTFNLTQTELFDLLKFLYQDVERNQLLTFAKLEKPKGQKKSLLQSSASTKREALEQLIDLYKLTVERAEFEPSFISLNFFLDLLNSKPFALHNEPVAYMMLYILLLSNGYRCLHLYSFFESLVKNQDKFINHIKQASLNWSEGLSNPMGLHRFILQRLLEAYRAVEYEVRNYTFDQQTNKSDYIENTINKLDEVFSKQDIRRLHPTISDSTINRTLVRMRDEKKIRPLGTGRSAKWMKLYPSTKKTDIFEQMKMKV